VFGCYRFLLAVAVVFQHTQLAALGAYAVFAFFTISGFLMTLLTCDTYKGRPMAFALNRFLRLFPQYWFTMLLMAGLVLWGLPLPRDDIGLPSVEDLVLDVAYINYWQDNPQLILTSWAVTNELVFYALIGSGLSANKSRTLLWFACSMVSYVFIQMSVARPSDLFYFSPVAASLPFSLGALTFHYGRLCNQSWAVPMALLAGSVMSIVVLLDRDGATKPLTQIPFLLAASVLTLSLFFFANKIGDYVRNPLAWRKLDDTVGMLSYPMYLNHFGAMMLVLPWITPKESRLTYSILTLVVSVLLAVMAILLVDNHVNRIRDRLRSSQ